uniref:Zona pellucida sperm-binding protein 3 n=1 Tax=Gouania willdenowi TaxID=441366 RepID=A0A8C5DP39_GOUWI
MSRLDSGVQSCSPEPDCSRFLKLHCFLHLAADWVREEFSCRFLTCVLVAITPMELFYIWANMLVGLFLSGVCIRLSFAFPPASYKQQPFFQKPLFSQTSTESKMEPQPVNTISVICHPDTLEILIKADMFAVGAPVNSNELRLGVEDLEHCRASPSMEDEYRIVVGLMDCGTKHWMTEDSLVYTNLMIYTPATSLNDDWLHERYSNVFYLGDLINVEASVRVGHHMGLRVFVSSCVATLTPDVTSEPSYTFIESGCLVDSQIPGSRSNFLPRTRNDKLQLSIDSFKFHNDNRVQLYLTCHLTAAPVNDPEAMNKACTLINERQVFGKSTTFGQDARVGPLMVLPRSKSKFVHFDELPPVLEKMRPAFYGSQWRSGVNKLGKSYLP